MEDGRGIRSGNRSSRGWRAILLLIFFTTGCDSLLSADAGFAKDALVRVSGESDVPVYVVTSVEFLAFRNGESGVVTATLLGADTTQLSELPYSHEHDVRGRDRFLVRLLNPDSTVTAAVLLEVVMDGKLVYTQHATLRDASLEFITLFRPVGGAW